MANEVGTSLQLIGEIDAACRDRIWSSVIHRCDEVRIRFSQLQVDPGLQHDERQAIREAIDEIQVIIVTIEKIQAKPEAKDVSPKVRKYLHDLIVFLGGVKGRLQSRTLEV